MNFSESTNVILQKKIKKIKKAKVYNSHAEMRKVRMYLLSTEGRIV